MHTRKMSSWVPLALLSLVPLVSCEADALADPWLSTRGHGELYYGTVYQGSDVSYSSHTPNHIHKVTDIGAKHKTRHFQSLDDITPSVTRHIAQPISHHIGGGVRNYLGPSVTHDVGPSIYIAPEVTQHTYIGPDVAHHNYIGHQSYSLPTGAEYAAHAQAHSNYRPAPPVTHTNYINPVVSHTGAVSHSAYLGPGVTHSTYKAPSVRQSANINPGVGQRDYHGVAATKSGYTPKEVIHAKYSTADAIVVEASYNPAPATPITSVEYTPVVGNYATVAEVPSVVTTQHHAQDEGGNFAFGYTNQHGQKVELGNSLTGVRGPYTGAGGQTVRYVADSHGFRIV